MINMGYKYNLRTWMSYFSYGHKKDFWFYFSLVMDILTVCIALSMLFFGRPALIELYEYVNATCNTAFDLSNYTIINESYNLTAFYEQ